MNTRDNKIKTTESVLERWSNFISDELATRTFFDKNEVSAYAKVQLKMALTELLAIHRDNLEDERINLVKKYSIAKGHAERLRIGSELADINNKLKEKRMAIADMNYKGDLPRRSPKIKIVSDSFVIGRIYDICPGRKDNTSELLVSITYNKNFIDPNDSNKMKFFTTQKNNDLVSGMNVGDIVKIEYQLFGSDFAGANGKPIYVTNLKIKSIRIWKDQGENDEWSVATGAQ